MTDWTAIRLLVDQACRSVVLGDVVLTDEEMVALCANLASLLPLGANRPEVEGALAIAAVNGLRNQPNRDGFRVYFCSLLGTDLPKWQQCLGPAIERFCVRTFADDPNIGQSYRYVGLVWRHAGLRPVDVPRVADWLCQLAKSGGGWPGLLAHPERVADEVVRARWASPYLAEFMKANGAGLCQHMVLLLARLGQGFVSPEEVREAGQRYVPLLEAIQDRSRVRPVRALPSGPARLPDPVVVLRQDAGALELCFDSAGVAAAAYDCDQLGSVTMPRVRLPSPKPWYSGTLGRGPARRSWGVVGWRNGPETQYFRTADGRRLSVGAGVAPARPPRQECYALSTEVAPAGVEVFEQFGRFALGGTQVYLLRVRAADAALEVAVPPELVWDARPGSRLPGACAGDVAVWTGPLPRLQVVPPEACAGWRVMAEWDGTIRRLSVESDGSVDVQVSPGVLASIWLEPPRELRRDSDPAVRTVRFVRLPPVVLRFPGRLLAADESCVFACEGDVEWRWPDAEPLDPGRRYQVAPTWPLIEGTVHVPGGATIPVIRLIPRAGLRAPDGSPPEEGAVWWLDGWERDVVVTGWPERPVRCRLRSPFGDAEEFNFPDSFDLGGEARLSGTAWRERLIRVAPLAGVEVYGPGAWAATGRWLGLARCLPAYLEAHRGAALAPEVSAAVRVWLGPLAELAAGNLPPQRWSALSGVPTALQPWVRRACARAAQALVAAGAEVPTGVEDWVTESQRSELRAIADRSRLAAWTAWVHAHFRDGYDPPPDAPLPRLLTEVASRYLDAGQDGGTSRRSKRLLDRVYSDLRDGLPDAADAAARTVAFVLAVFALWHRQGADELRRAADALSAAIQPPEVPAVVTRLCGLNLPVAGLALGDLPLWPVDLRLEDVSEGRAAAK